MFITNPTDIVLTQDYTSAPRKFLKRNGVTEREGAGLIGHRIRFVCGTVKRIFLHEGVTRGIGDWRTVLLTVRERS